MLCGRGYMCKELPRVLKSAFSLIELSIVLVILGLLAGGVLSGRSLIHAAELRAISSEYEKLSAAVYTFRDKYFSLPGDMRNATAFWGATGGTGCVNNSGTATTSPGTCDGNGDGIIDGAASGGKSGETTQYWRHLALAGLIEGTYTGITDEDPSSGGWPGHACTVGTSCPSSKYPKAGWGVGYDQGAATKNGNYQFNFSNFYGFGAAQNGSSIPDATLLKPEDAWNIDKKLDDGMPGTGFIFARDVQPDDTAGFGTAAACTTSTSSADFSGKYNLTNSSPACAFKFFRLF